MFRRKNKQFILDSSDLVGFVGRKVLPSEHDNLVTYESCKREKN